MLNEKHRQIAILTATTTMTNNDIAEKVQCHYNTVSRALKNPEVQLMIDQIREGIEEKVFANLSDKIDQAAFEAFERLKELMRNGPPPVSFRAAESILDRSSVSPKRQIHSKHDVQGKVMHLHFGRNELERMHNVLIEEAGGDLSKVPELPELDENGEYVVEVDPVTGEVLGEGF